MKASECKCTDCKGQAEVFWPVFDPDIPSYLYCRTCVDKRKFKLLIDMYDDKQKNTSNQKNSKSW